MYIYFGVMSITNIVLGKKEYNKAVFVLSKELCHKIACKSGSIAPYILNLDASCGERWALRSGHLI
jgi:hypothetical protein